MSRVPSAIPATEVPLVLGLALKARDGAMSARAPELVTVEFSDAERDFTQARAAFARGDSSSGQDLAGELVGRFRELESKAILENTLGRARWFLQIAKDEGAWHWAPNTLQNTARLIADAETQARRDLKNASELRRISQETERAAVRLLEVSRRSRRLSEARTETLALFLQDLENELGTVSRVEAKQRLRQQFDQTRALLLEVEAFLGSDQKYNRVPMSAPWVPAPVSGALK